jgi:hypothetical protein
MDTKNLGITRRFRYNGYRRPIDELFGPPELIKKSSFVNSIHSFVIKFGRQFSN